MRIAIFHELLIKLGGAEVLVKNLSDMFPDAPIYTLLYDEKKCSDFFGKRKIISSKVQKYYNMGLPFNMIRTKMPQAVESFDFSQFDLLISSSSAFTHGAITNTDTKHLCYCHSPARFLWDWHFEVIREQTQRSYFGGMKKMLIQALTHKIRLWDRAVADRPDRIIANSKTVQKRIKKFWGQDSEIIYPPIDTDRFSLKKSHEGYFFIVSTLAPYKNIDLAVKAFNRIPKHKLVIIGDGPEREYLQNLASSNVEILGRKSDDVVREYMRNCRAFIFPGLEDFGMAPVEAMACGKPVIAFGKGGVTESVVEGKTGIFFKEATEDSILDALVDFFDIEEDFKADEIRNQAEKFSKDVFEKSIVREIEKLMKK